MGRVVNFVDVGVPEFLYFVKRVVADALVPMAMVDPTRLPRP